MLNETIARLVPAPRSSFFLFGPRGSGKSTWVRGQFPGATRVDLLDEALYQDLLARPGLFADLLRDVAAATWVSVDEVQRLPQLLHDVHRLIEERRLKFVLTGSSARKLKRAGVNLLGGRAVRRTMSPFLPQELGHRFELGSALRFGTLPVVLASESPTDTLRAYAQAYLKEEIQAEALTRNLPGFARFLPVAGIFHGQVLNVSSLARDAGVARTTVNDYVDILEDTLLAFRLPAFETKLRARERRHPKLYWIDPGLVRAVKRQLGPVAAEEVGPLFEGLVAVMLRTWGEYFELFDDIGYWASGSGVEVDFILSRGKRRLAIEVKSSERLRPEDTRGLDALKDLAGLARRLLVYRGRRRFVTESGIDVLPFEALVRELSDDRLWP